jgi:hypothetical protein
MFSFCSISSILCLFYFLKGDPVLNGIRTKLVDLREKVGTLDLRFSGIIINFYLIKHIWNHFLQELKLIMGDHETL